VACAANPVASLAARFYAGRIPSSGIDLDHNPPGAGLYQSTIALAGGDPP
jgi:hypothetical protein